MNTKIREKKNMFGEEDVINNVFSGFFKQLQSKNHFEEWELALLSESIEVRKVKKGTNLLKAGKISKELYYVNKGCLRTFYTIKDGSEPIRCLALEKSFCWAMPSFITQDPSIESIDVLIDSELFVFSKSIFKMLNEKSINFKNAYHSWLETLCIIYSARIESLITINATLRYKNILNENPAIIQKLPNKIVASYLGITQESLSRIKAKM
jgi:CRP-like cAMP-binding protein